MNGSGLRIFKRSKINSLSPLQIITTATPISRSCCNECNPIPQFHFQHPPQLNLGHPILSKLETCQNMKQFSQIHAQMMVHGMSYDPFPASRLLKFTTSSLYPPNIPLSAIIFSQIRVPDVYSYNLMIKAFSLGFHPLTSFSLYHTLLLQGLLPNEYTLCFLLSCCAATSAFQAGWQVHAHVTKCGFIHGVFVGTSLIHMYGSCRALYDALQAFDALPQRSHATWGAVICACVINGELIKGLQLMVGMTCLGVEAGNVVLVSALCACCKVGVLNVGRMIHAYVQIRGLDLNVTLGTSLVNMYAKFGAIDLAIAVFRTMPRKSVATWNCMICGLAINSRAQTALEFFEEMQEAGIPPNGATFVGVLHACSHAGLVTEGAECFLSMSGKHGIEPNIKHYGCMVDLFSRVGWLREAMEVIRKMPLLADVAIWGALFGACRIHGDHARLGEAVGAQIIKLHPCHTGGYTFLSETYALAECWDNVGAVQEAMMEMNIRKMPGCSIISD